MQTTSRTKPAINSNLSANIRCSRSDPGPASSADITPLLSGRPGESHNAPAAAAPSRTKKRVLSALTDRERADEGRCRCHSFSDAHSGHVRTVLGGERRGETRMTEESRGKRRKQANPRRNRAKNRYLWSCGRDMAQDSVVT
ncbi:hypothetical protein WMY93_019812 [Mugilogobius chulae]|uniref:Uncharacterized protein n=1 Tax=Mugilogobius chulae TaxID=88201 RepID=A0AAW0NL43_9GOBI